MKLRVRRLDSAVPLPQYAHNGDAALDMHAAENYVLQPQAITSCKTGLCVAIPEGHVGIIKGRSGLAAKQGIHPLAGVIDSGYRGEIDVVLVNLGKAPVQITKGMRIAQMLIQPVVRVDIEEAETLEETVRGSSGFGSTGM